jgi:thioredoxin reductase
MKVIIVGAGIAGLAAGIALRRKGHDVKVRVYFITQTPLEITLDRYSNARVCSARLEQQ